MSRGFFEYSLDKKKKFLETATYSKLMHLCEKIIRYKRIDDFILFLDSGKMPMSRILQELYDAKWESKYIIMAIEKGAPLYEHSGSQSFDLLYEVCKSNNTHLAKYFMLKFDIDQFKTFPFFKFLAYSDTLSDAMHSLVTHTQQLRHATQEKDMLSYNASLNEAKNTTHKKILKI